MTHRHQLPQSEGDLFLTDGGIETTLIFHEGLDLPHFAAFHLLRSPEGTEALRAYFRTYARLARRLGTGLVLESATWRANRDWAKLLGYSPADLAHANRRAVELLEEIRDGMSAHVAPVVISGCVGPRGDGYRVDEAMSAAEAAAYHAEQIETFQGSAADMASAITMTYVDEAVGVARAARAAGMPVAISFTVETDGRLPSGTPLGDAIEAVDADTGGYPVYYMINCAHPTHFMHVLDPYAGWRERIGGLRANASRMSHAELDESPTLDEGDPVELAEQYAELVRALPGVTVLGGCCGTDHRHVERIGRVCKPLLESTQVSLGT
jgi:S-methylmethionine-dependent homocysteine/selenocysteine methylase